MSDDESKRVQAALLRAVASGARTRRALSGAVRGRSGNAAYQRARKFGLIGGRAAPAGPTGPWPAPAERRALAAALWRMARDGMRHLADLIDPTCHAVHPDTAADDELVCSECGAYMGAIAPFIGAVLPLYCPSCGARVVEGGEG